MASVVAEFLFGVIVAVFLCARVTDEGWAKVDNEKAPEFCRFQDATFRMVRIRPADAVEEELR